MSLLIPVELQLDERFRRHCGTIIKSFIDDCWDPDTWRCWVHDDGVDHVWMVVVTNVDDGFDGRCWLLTELAPRDDMLTEVDVTEDP